MSERETIAALERLGTYARKYALQCATDEYVHIVKADLALLAQDLAAARVAPSERAQRLGATIADLRADLAAARARIAELEAETDDAWTKVGVQMTRAEQAEAQAAALREVLANLVDGIDAEVTDAEGEWDTRFDSAFTAAKALLHPQSESKT